MAKEGGLFSNLPMAWWVKVITILITLVFSVMYTIPTMMGDRREWPRVDTLGNVVTDEAAVVGENGVGYKKWHHRVADTLLPNSRVSLGLDLRGGLHLVLEVDAEKSVRDAMARAISRARDSLVAEKIEITDITVQNDYTVRAKISDPTKAEAFKDAVVRQTALVVFEKIEGNTAIFLPRKDRVNEEKERVLQQAMNTVRNRIDQFNVAEPNIFQQGADRVVIQLPGMKEPERAKSLIGNTARLDFRLVLDEVPAERIPDLVKEARDALQIVESDVKPETIAKISTWLQDKGKLSKNAVIMVERKYGQIDGKNKLLSAVPYIVEANSRLTGELIENANSDAQSGGLLPEWGVSLQFKPQGGKLFGEITTEAFKKQKSTGAIAIILDDNVNSAPHVNEPILNGSARITMGRQSGGEDSKMKEAQDLALVLRAGALPAKVTIVEERQVGPSEGEENIRAGVFSSSVATTLVVLFMIWVYGNSGIVANLAMLFNVFITLSLLAAFGATLTLPGIAGITLTLAMAVDGNVVINERIREELRAGLNPRAAFYQGYNMSFMTLVDAHLTAAFAGIILLMYGNPAVRGFAVTLLIGIIATLFTSYFVTEVIGQWLVEKTKIKRFA
jgi:protein-export membrane protein SecD